MALFKRRALTGGESAEYPVAPPQDYINNRQVRRIVLGNLADNAVYDANNKILSWVRPSGFPANAKYFKLTRTFFNAADLIFPSVAFTVTVTQTNPSVTTVIYNFASQSETTANFNTPGQLATSLTAAFNAAGLTSLTVDTVGNQQFLRFNWANTSGGNQTVQIDVFGPSGINASVPLYQPNSKGDLDVLQILGMFRITRGGLNQSNTFTFFPAFATPTGQTGHITCPYPANVLMPQSLWVICNLMDNCPTNSMICNNETQTNKCRLMLTAPNPAGIAGATSNFAFVDEDYAEDNMYSVVVQNIHKIDAALETQFGYRFTPPNDWLVEFSFIEYVSSRAGQPYSSQQSY